MTPYRKIAEDLYHSLDKYENGFWNQDLAISRIEQAIEKVVVEKVQTLEFLNGKLQETNIVLQELPTKLVKEIETLEEMASKLKAENTKLRAALEKIVEAETIGYGTQRTYGEMVKKALDEINKDNK